MLETSLQQLRSYRPQAGFDDMFGGLPAGARNLLNYGSRANPHSGQPA